MDHPDGVKWQAARRMRACAVLPLLACAALAACGGDPPPPDPADDVRAAAVAYVGALRAQRWEDACARMTAGARATIAEGGGSCAGALAAGGALPADVLGTVARLLPGAAVEVEAGRATVGPVGDVPAPLRLVQRDGRWLVAG